MASTGGSDATSTGTSGGAPDLSVTLTGRMFTDRGTRADPRLDARRDDARRDDPDDDPG